MKFSKNLSSTFVRILILLCISVTTPLIQSFNSDKKDTPPETKVVEMDNVIEIVSQTVSFP